jgi:hypothetical protein
MTRFLLYSIAALVLLNVAAVLWPNKTASAAHVYAAREDVNPHFVRLNREIEGRFYSQPTETVSENLNSESLGLSKAPEVSLAGSNLVVAAAACYRIGPFVHQANYELAQAVLFNADVDYKKSKRASKASNVFRIYLGPFEDQSEVDSARIDLKRQKILDHFVRKQDNGSMVISLGIYSTPESAAAAFRLFSDNLADVQRRSENVVLPDSYWLHFGIGTDDRMLAQLSLMDWGEPSAQMGLFNCGD